MIKLIEVGEDNWRLGLKVSEAQKKYVSDSAGLLARAYAFSQLFIDERYQGNGYGYAATQKILGQMKTDGKYNKVILCCIEGNNTAIEMYKKAGFKPTGEQDEDEIIMELQL